MTRGVFLRGLLATVMSPSLERFPLASSPTLASSTATKVAANLSSAAIGAISELSRIMSWFSHDTAGLRALHDPNEMAFTASALFQKVADMSDAVGTNSLDLFKEALAGRLDAKSNSTANSLMLNTHKFLAQIEQLKAHAQPSHPAGAHVARWLDLLKNQDIDAVNNDPVRISTNKYLRYLQDQLPLSDAEAAKLRNELSRAGIDPTLKEDHFDSFVQEDAIALISQMRKIENILVSDRSRKCLPLPESLVSSISFSLSLLVNESGLSDGQLSFKTSRMRRLLLRTFPEFDQTLHNAKAIIGTHESEKNWIRDWSDLLTMPTVQKNSIH